ncbi:DMT family transporter [Guyparkeria sp. SCN-R1]|uniref:DMT family transporter n=1 Tax=Guyparkeria sp. SCN-R1 TaxID=2341113 RepID=UPI000F652408|nr:DMT family transporter [Guyparkeria sp. SCN-R1]RRQ23291.1 DMT family transporter [Guyparkeria sp. SCN-R1]
MGIALVMLAAVLWGVSGGIAAVLIERGWDPLVVSFYRGVVGFLCFAAWWLARFAVIPFPDRRAILWSALAGLGVAGNFIFYFLSISQANVAVAVTLMYTAPIYVYLVSLATGAVRLTPGFVAAIGSVLLGVALLTQLVGSENLSGLSVAGVAAGVAAGISYAVFLFGFRNAAIRTSPVVALGVAFLVFLLVMAPLVDPGKVVSASLSDDAHLFLLLGLFGAGISFVFYVLGLRRASPVAVALVAAVEPVTASLFSLVVLGQSLAPLQWLGMVVIIATVTALAVRQH